MPSSAAALTVNPNDGDLAISPDGRRLVYTSTSAVSTAAQLIVRAIDQFEGKPIQGLGSPRHPFISPDGQRIGFFDGVEALKKVSIDGGAAVTICRVNGRPRGATWGPDDTIVFATDDPATGLARVPAAGGEPQVLTRPDRQQEEDDHLWPEFLPNGRAVLFTIVDRGNFRIAALGWPGGERKALIPSRTADADARDLLRTQPGSGLDSRRHQACLWERRAGRERDRPVLGPMGRQHATRAAARPRTLSGSARMVTRRTGARAVGSPSARHVSSLKGPMRSRRQARAA